MALAEGNTVQQTEAPTAKAIADAVAANLRETQQQQKQPSAYEQLMQQIESNPDTDRDQLDLHKRITAALKEDLKREVMAEAGNQTWNELVRERDNAAVAFVDSELERIFDGEENAEKIAALVRREIVDEVRSSDKHKDLRDSLAKGNREHAALRKIVKDHSEAIASMLKREAKGANGVSGFKQGASSSQAKEAAEPDVEGKTYDDLTSRQKEQYSARRQMCVRAGMKAEEAEKEAMRSALSVKKYGYQ